MTLDPIRAVTSAIPRAARTLKRRGLAGLPALYRQHHAVVARSEWVEPRINALQIEPTKRCNQKCPMCTQPTLTKEQKGDMSFAQFRSIIDQMPDLTELKLQGLGEIMLNRDIWQMLEYAVERRIRILFADNALLMSEEAAKKLCQLGNVDIRFSLDSLDRERYAKIRGVDTMERVLTNIRRFTEIRREHGQRSLTGSWAPSAEFRMVCMDENLHELPALIRFAAEIGIERVAATFMLSKNHSSSQSEFADQKTTQLHESGLGEAEAEAVREAKRVGVSFKTLSYNDDIMATCDWPWRMPYVTYDGYVTSCCHIENPEAGHFGNLFEQTFEQIWNGPAYRAFRRDFTDLAKNKNCRVCPYLTKEQLAPFVEQKVALQGVVTTDALLSKARP